MSRKIFWRHFPERAWILGAVAKPAIKIFAIEDSGEALRSLVLGEPLPSRAKPSRMVVENVLRIVDLFCLKIK